jgi:hypothetical protein
MNRYLTMIEETKPGFSADSPDLPSGELRLSVHSIPQPRSPAASCEIGA